MICTNCGAVLDDDLNFCTQCGTPLKQTDVVSENVEAEAYAPEAVIDEAYVPEEVYTLEVNDEVYVPQVEQEPSFDTQFSPEFNQTQYQEQYHEQQAYAPQTPVTDPGKGLGIASMVVSIVGAVLCNLFGITPIVGLILGIVANSKSKKAGFKNGFAIAGIVIGAVSIVLFVLCIVVTVILSLFVPSVFSLLVALFMGGSYYY